MPFKKTDEGWEYDPNGTARIKTARSNPFTRVPRDNDGRPLVYNPETGDWEVDYKKLLEEINERDAQK